MNAQSIFDALAHAEAVVRAHGENVVFGYYPADDLYEGSVETFTANLRLQGVPNGIHASSTKGWGAAWAKADADRADRRRELAREAAIRAEVEARMNMAKAA